MTDMIPKAKEALGEAGLVLNGPLDMSGKMAMCGTTKKPNGTDGRYIFHADFPPNITIINHHAGGQKQIIPLWKPGEWEGMPETERKALQEKIRLEKAEAIRRRKRVLQEAKAQAQKFFNPLSIAGDDNAYLQRKGIKAHGDLRQAKRGDLVIPVYDATGAICSGQFITRDGNKRFMPGKLPEIYFSVIPAKDRSTTGTLRIAEGYATAASIHEATGDTVLIAFSCHNLENVAVFARSKYADRNIVICADNDKPTSYFPECGGKGVFHAKKAAQAVNASIAICPLFDGRDNADFNDLHAAYGLERVKAELDKTVPVTTQNNNAWPEIIPFTSSVGPKIDASKLPEGVFRDFCVELSEATQTPLELCVGMALAVVATVAQRQYVVRVKPDYVEPVNMFIMCPLESANRKSAVVRACMEPLKEWEHEQAEKVEPLIRQAASKRQTIQKAIDGLRAKAVKNAH